MSFQASWYTLLNELEELADDATLITPLSNDQYLTKHFQLTAADGSIHAKLVDRVGS